MSIRIIGQRKELSYDSNRPLEEQLQDSQHVIINYEPSNADINTFVREVERLYRAGVNPKLELKMAHNDHLKGIKTKKKLGKLVKNIEINEVIKQLVNLHSTTDTVLEELINFCKKG